MSDTPKAVFLSYASQDAEAAKRICDALRAAGVEVWFDQSELVGGDAWDQKIRGQISSCALFIPVISANTQARREGYFRIEWKLAAQRTYAIADDEAFLLPVVIDDTKDAVAKVPPEFKTVQWTKLQGGETPPAFCSRVKKLLEEGPFDVAQDRQGAGSTEQAASAGRTQNQKPRTKNRRLGRLWWALPIVGLTMALGWVLKQSRTGPAVSLAAPAPAVASLSAPDSAGWKLAQRALDVLTSKEGISRERLEAADQFCKQALDLDPLDGRIFAVAARVDTEWVYYQMDKSEARQQQAKNRAARAAVLAPAHPQVRYAQAEVYATVIGGPAMQAEAEKLLRGLKDDPDVGHDAQVRLGTLLRDTGRAAEAAVFFEQIGDLGSAGWAYASAGKDDEVLRVVDILLRRGHSVGALIQKYNVMLRREDLAAMADVVRQFTPEDQLDDGYAVCAIFLALCQRDVARILEIAAASPREYYSAPGFFEPKRYQTGWAHRLAGRPELARTDWRSALTTVEELLKVRPTDLDLLSWQAVLQGWLGDQADAEKNLQLCLSLAKEPTGVDAFLARLRVNLGLGRTEESIQQLLTAGFNAQQMLEIHAFLRFSPEFDSIRGDPRFEKFMRDTLPAEAKPLDDARRPVPDDAPAPTLQARQLVKRALTISRETRESRDLADQLVGQALVLAPNDIQVLLDAAGLDFAMIYPQRWDVSEARVKQARKRASQALALAPDSTDAQHLQAKVLAHAVRTPESLLEAEKIYRDLLTHKPGDADMSQGLALVLREAQRFDEAAVLYEQIGDIEQAGWSYFYARRYPEAKRAVLQALATGRTVHRLRLLAYIELVGNEDLEATAAAHAQLKPSELLAEMPASDVAVVALWRRRPDRVLQVTGAVLQDYLYTGIRVGMPKQYLSSSAYMIAGRPESARNEWVEGLAVVERLLRDDPHSLRLLFWKIWFEAQLGRKMEAGEALNRYQVEAGLAPGTVTLQTAAVFLALGHRQEVLDFLESLSDAQMTQSFHVELRYSPDFDSLRGDARFEKLLRDHLPAGAKPFDNAQGRPSGDAQGRSFDDSKGKPAKSL